MRAAYSALNLRLRKDPGSQDFSQAAAEDGSPQNQLSIRSYVDLPEQFSTDGVLRYVDDIAGPGESYVELDLRLARRFGKLLELSAVGRDLLERRHTEFAGGTDVERSFFGQLRAWW